MINNVLILWRLVLTNLTKHFLVGGRRSVLDLDRGHRYLLAVRSSLFSLRCKEGSPWRGCAGPLGAAEPDRKCLKPGYFVKPVSQYTPGAPQTVIKVVDAVVVEVFRQRLDSEADDDGSYDDDHRDDDDDRQVEEVAAFRVFITGCSLLDIIEHLALHHF